MTAEVKQTVQYPWIVNLELTNACNLVCVFCDHRILKKKMRAQEMDSSLLRKILSDIRCMVKNRKMHELGLVGLGEPTLDKHLSTHLKIIDRHADSFERVSFNSNLVSLNKSKVNALLDSSINTYTFSVNASNRKLYCKMMGRDVFNTVVKNLATFLDMVKQKQKKVSIGIQLFNSESNSLEELRKFCPTVPSSQVNFFYRELYVKPVLQRKHPSLIFPETNSDSHYPCWDIYSRVYIDVRGNLYPCTIGNDCYREESDYCLGNIKDNSLLGLFNGPKIILARQRCEYGGLPFDDCNICNIWSLTPNNFTWDDEKQRWEKKRSQVRSFGLKG